MKILINSEIDFDKKKVANIFFVNEGKILILKRNSSGKNFGKFNLPGGKIDSGETPLMAALRELKEETGIKIDYANFFRKTIKDDKIIYHFFYFSEKRPEVYLNNEHSSYKWVSFKEFIKKDTIYNKEEFLLFKQIYEKRY